MNEKSIAALENLRRFPPVGDTFETSKRSAVLVPLILNPFTGDLEVILTVRSSSLRTNAGDVAFPGGKKDLEDIDLIATAKREAFEEIGLPREASEYLTTLYPVLSRHYQVVTPVVAYCAHLTTKDIAQLHPNPGEVAAIFTTPLEHFLDPPKGSYGYFDMHWLSSPHRVHRFDGCGADNYILEVSEITESSSIQQDFKQGKTGDTAHHDETETAFPGWSVYGMTAGVMVEVAKVAYARPPSFQEYALDQVRDVGLMAKWHNQTFTRSRL
ncbi:Peroxisomal coenzyme A diphosphatase nudt7 [Podila minutissima]|uniref:Peroxisomal coenzyme A diphosphatase nudt7 n=1 Tax=Podila minutissima TaxID=64525 RepID=A0A9P5SGY0_9FUNG|nr:Peroxisomal coenzyme A diphosphatase nudt7 [Podila minutissima]